MKHETIKASHYDNAAENYDAFNEDNSRIINQTIASILKNYQVVSVLDMTCGTGSQVIYLAKRGFTIRGSDINTHMLTIARNKVVRENLNIQLIQSDMSTLHVGQFDAVITIFNAIGHLTKSDFEKAIRNIRGNLKEGGIYIFDIFNLQYLLEGNNITRLTIDWQKRTENTQVRDIQYSTINSDGVLASYTIHYEQHASEQPKISQSVQTLQVYTAQQLQDLLYKNEFQVMQQCNIDGTEFNEIDTERILTIAKKT